MNFFRRRFAVFLAAAFCGLGFACMGHDATPISDDELGAGNHRVSYRHDGQTREMIVHVPAIRESRAPLLIALHGGGQNAAQMQRYANLDALADLAGFVVAYPEGTRAMVAGDMRVWNAGFCCGRADSENVDDVGAMRTIAGKLVSAANIDKSRVYVTGISNGGMMAYKIACDAADLVAAIAPVAGSIPRSCQPSEPVSVIAFHGTADENVPYGGGVGDDSLTGVENESVDEAMSLWREADGCDGAAETRTIGNVELSRWSCQDGHEVARYKILGGGHTWPGANAANWGSFIDTPNAGPNAVMWEHLSGHHR
ncbi:polyhydroxybutyrate depolymerase [bacterium]|nr:polyhydroxybutyrate depolymerase [bacterium]